MVIECNECNCKVKARVIAQHIERLIPTDDVVRFSFLECPSCKGCLLACEDQCIVGPNAGDLAWGEPRRTWPKEQELFDQDIPSIVRTSFNEALTCFSAGGYLASAVMCGRALEGVCAAFKTKNKVLAGGLKELLEREVIDKKLYQWAQETRRLRNIAAHATDETVSREDAQDLLEFTKATAEYVFVLAKKFEEFMTRAKKNKKIASSVQDGDDA